MTRLTAATLRADVVALFSPARPPATPGAVGVELELLAAGPAGPDGRPAVLPLQPDGREGPSLIGFLEAYGRRTERLAPAWDELGTPAFRTARGGRLVFEPGGQLELSTEPRPTAAAVLEDAERVLGPLVAAAAAEGIRLEARGLDPWHGEDEVGLQLATPRYRLMDLHFGRLGGQGRRMMRLTAGMQVNLDFGDPRQAKRRWRAANLLAPVGGAVFANSPCRLPDGSAVRSGRAVAWEGTDPSRTGFPIADGPGPLAAPWEAYLRFAMGAEVMMRLGAGGLPVSPGGRFRFGEWCSGARPPPPTAQEWRVHLTTLFPQVRPRGWLELRWLDVPRPEWWGVPLTLLPALLYDDGALAETLEILEPLAERRADLMRRAARKGLRDGALAGAAGDLFDSGLRAVERFPRGYFSGPMVEATREYAERYIRGRRTQADDEKEAACRAELPPGELRAGG